MNKYTEQQIEEKLRELALIEPTEDSVRRMNQGIRNVIANIEEKPAKAYTLLYYAAASAAVLLIGIGLLYHSRPVKIQPPVVWSIPKEPTLSLAHLNAVFNSGGQKALDEYLETIESTRQPRAETLTLQEIMKDL